MVSNFLTGSSSQILSGSTVDSHVHMRVRMRRGCGRLSSLNDNDNDSDTLREVPHPSNEGLALQARVSGS